MKSKIFSMTKFIQRQIVNLRSEDFTVSLQRLIYNLQYSLRTEQIFIVINNDLWWRLYWNTIFQTWEVTRHTRRGWEPTIELTTQYLLPLISENREILEKSQGFEHKNVAQVTIYFRRKVSLRVYRPEPIQEVEP